nr:unnamed protein product [Spirometra erinaceieuropaei]
MVYQRVIRNPIFASSNDSTAGTNGSSAGFKLQPIEFLLALGAKEESVVVLGALTQLKNGQWYLEDPTNLVKLDLSAATFHQGLFPEGAIVLAEGSFDDDVFKVTGIGLPPVEEPHLTRRYFSVPNPFGGSIVDGPAAAADTNMIRLLQTHQATSDMLVLLGETRLDMPGCIEHLETLFLGYLDCPPTAFVLCGDFIGPEFATYNSFTNKSAVLKKLFRRLFATLSARRVSTSSGCLRGLVLCSLVLCFMNVVTRDLAYDGRSVPPMKFESAASFSNVRCKLRVWAKPPGRGFVLL